MAGIAAAARSMAAAGRCIQGTTATTLAHAGGPRRGDARRRRRWAFGAEAVVAKPARNGRRPPCCAKPRVAVKGHPELPETSVQRCVQLAQRWHEPGLLRPGARSLGQDDRLSQLEEALMGIVAGFDVHRRQITFDALD